MHHAFKHDEFPNDVRENRRTVTVAHACWMTTFTIVWWVAIQIAAGRLVWFW